MSNRKSISAFLKNTMIIAAGKFSTQFIVFLLLPLYTSRIPSDEYGIVDLIITYTSLFVPVITLQQEFAVFRYLIDARKNLDEIRKVISSSLATVIKLLLIALLFAVPIMLLLHVPFCHLIIPNIIVVSFSNYLLQVSRGIGRTTLYSIACILGGLITVIMNMVLVLAMGRGAESILISSICSNAAIILFLCVALGFIRLISTKYIDKKLKKELIIYSIPVVFNGISWWIINASDRTILASLISVSVSGIYAVANNFSSIINSLFYIFSMSWAEAASIHIKDTDRDEFCSTILNGTICIFFSLSSGLIACLPFLMPIFVKEEYLESAAYIPFLIIGALSNCMAGYYAGLYSATKETKKVMTTSFLAAIMNVIINLIFIRLIGVWAAVISTIIAFLLIAFIRHLDISKTIKVRINKKKLLVSLFVLVLITCLYYCEMTPIRYISLAVAVISAALLNLDTIKMLKEILIKKH